MRMLGNEWEKSIIRQAMVELGDEEGVRLFDKEQEEMRRKAEAEIAEMRAQGMLLEDEIIEGEFEPKTVDEAAVE